MIELRASSLFADSTLEKYVLFKFIALFVVHRVPRVLLERSECPIEGRRLSSYPPHPTWNISPGKVGTAGRPGGATGPESPLGDPAGRYSPVSGTLGSILGLRPGVGSCRQNPPEPRLEPRHPTRNICPGKLTEISRDSPG